jgi:hypothetical protein
MSFTRHRRRSGPAGFLRKRSAIGAPAKLVSHWVFSFENAKKFSKRINMALTTDFFPFKVTSYALLGVFESSVLRNYGTRSDKIVSCVLKLDVLT